MTFALFQEDRVIECLFEVGAVRRPSVFAEAIPSSLGTVGEWMILYTELGFLVVQYIIPTGSAIPSHFTILDSLGQPLSDKASIDVLTSLEPELNGFEFVPVSSATSGSELPSIDGSETIVEVKGSSECFEFQFPASPEYFVGRDEILDEVSSLSEAILSRRSGLRGILLEANSGWGKSSCVLASAQRLRTAGNFAIAIDSRSASSPQFILRVVEYTLSRVLESGVVMAPQTRRITGFDGAADALVAAGEQM